MHRLTIAIPDVRQIRRVEFHRTKYGPELLVDVAWVHDMPAFIVDRPHALTFYDIILVTRGRGTFSLDGHPYAVRPGVMLFTRPGQVRDWHVDALDGVCLFFTATFLDEFLRDPTFLARLPYFDAPAGAAALTFAPRARDRVCAGLERMRRELHALRDDSIHLLRARLYEMLVTIARRYARRYTVAAERPTHPVVSRFRALVERDAPRRHAVADYARTLAVSPGHLNALCHRTLGANAKRVIESELAARARRRLLYTDETAAEIGAALGFADPSYFSRFVRRETGRSPSSFRKGR